MLNYIFSCIAILTIFILFLRVIIFIIIYVKYKRKIKVFLVDHSLHDELRLYNNCYSSIRSFDYVKKLKSFYMTNTDDSRLNELKKITWSKKLRIDKAIKIWLLSLPISIVVISTIYLI